MDIQSDEHGLWILYREKKKDTLTVSRVSIPSLKYLSLYIFCKYFLIRLLHTWNLPFQPSQYCNSFIRCGILHSITCSSQSSSIKPIYDFYSALPIIGKSTTLSGLNQLLIINRTLMFYRNTRGRKLCSIWSNFSFIVHILPRINIFNIDWTIFSVLLLIPPFSRNHCLLWFPIFIDYSFYVSPTGKVKRDNQNNTA